MIAVHHLNVFLYDQTRNEQNDLQRNIIKNLQLSSKNDKMLYDEIVYYKTFSRDGPVIFESLPLIRINWFQKLLQ
ncbi:unnamed protein product [Rotaria magnacalcarata]|nr:unnamed protein product [Rotaria magnacalcarata]